MGLIDRINQREPQVKLVVLPPRRKPAWLRRMDEQGLPDKDYTSQVKAR